MNADLITLVAVAMMFVVGLGALAVTYRALRQADRYHREALRAEASAARYKALVGASVFEFEPPRRPRTDDRPTQPMPRINERHLPPVAQGGSIASVWYRPGMSDGT